MEDQVKTLVRKRASIKGSITKIENTFRDKEACKEFSKQALLLKEERLRNAFQKYEEYSLEICAIEPDLDADDDVEEKYLKTLTVIMELLDDCDIDYRKECITKFNTKLPTINVPTYSGKYSEFKPFIQLFDSLIHNNHNLDDVQKFFYLRNFLREEPHDLVKNLMLSTESYHEARKILFDRYDNKYKITNEHIHILLDIVPISKSTASNLRNFVSVVKQQLAALKNLGHSVDQWDPIVLCILTRKLDLLCSREFQLARVQDPTVVHLIDFLDKRALALENAERPPERSQPASKVSNVAAVKKAKPDAGSAAEVVGTRSCLLCKSNHKLFTCPQFKLMSASERIKFASSNKICEICLNNHNKKCRYHFKCDVCKEEHNTLLHEDKPLSPVTLMSEAASEQVLLPTAQVKLLAKNGTEVHVKALLDTGSQASFVTKELANLLKLQIDTANTPVIGIGNNLNKLKEKVNIEVHSLTQNYKITVTCYLLDKITSKLPQRKFDLRDLVLPPKIMLADKKFNEPSNIHILLGADIFFQILLPHEPRVLPSSSEAADSSVNSKAPLLNTRLGYVIAGNTPTQHTEPVVTLFCKKCDSDLNKSIVEFWKCESVPETFPETHSEHDLCEKIFCASVEQDTKNNKIQVGLPLKLPLDSINQALGDSLYLALKRFHNLFYDPLGLAGPIVVSAKAIMQCLWQEKLEWDSVPIGELLQLWHRFYNSLLTMKPMLIPRHIGVHDTSFTQIIGFADASSNIGYGCCVYLRVVDSVGNVKIALLCSKSRINPISQSLSVPRLELNATLLLAKLVSRVHNVLTVKMQIQDVILYSDSQIVLAWLKTNINTLKAYTANRVKVISELTQKYTWAYVSTNENPADCLSRGVMPDELADHDLWWKGPAFLRLREYKPQFNLILPQDLPEVSVDSACLSAMLCTTSGERLLCLDFLEKFSNINKMIRVLAYILRFGQNAKSKISKNKLNYITTQELDLSLSMIVKYEQQKYLSEEIHVLKCNKTTVKGNLKPLCPFIDDTGLVRVGGRLQNASIPYTQKHPIVLPKDSRVTNLIITSEHIKNLHAGSKLVLSSINQRFWIVNGLRQVRKVLHKCTVCFRLKAESAKQLMGSLPPDRVNVCRPFQKVGLDYAGPIPLKIARIRKPIISKGYICLFVCFVTKAIHLELASDLKTETFIACLNRFISRRGLPTDIYSDNASTFKCAKNQLNELHHLHNSPVHQRQVCQFSAQKRINFHFLPCYSPVFAGLAEAGVKSVKYHLKRVLLKSILTYEELYTVLCQIESSLNSRPLMPLSNDPNDYSCITPGHFLIGTALNTYPEPNVNIVKQSQFWKICNEIKMSFWKVWSKHYLNLLQSRPKWQDTQPNVKVGTLVILRDDNLSPLYWPLARVINTYPGKDGKVRVVEVKTANGHTHKRAVMKVCVLPQECSGDN